MTRYQIVWWWRWPCVRFHRKPGYYWRQTGLAVYLWVLDLGIVEIRRWRNP